MRALVHRRPADAIGTMNCVVACCGYHSPLRESRNPLIVERNGIGAKIMQENQILIAGFYGILVTKLDLAVGDRFHWTKPAYELLAQEAARHVAQALRLSLPAGP